MTCPDITLESLLLHRAQKKIDRAVRVAFDSYVRRGLLPSAGQLVALCDSQGIDITRGTAIQALLSLAADLQALAGAVGGLD